MRHTRAAISAVLLFLSSCGSGGGPDTAAISEGTSSSPTSAIAAPPIADVPAVAVIPGTSDVTADGAATYTIPLEVLRGRAGMQPVLALSYSSRGGPSWAVSGVGSQITRCGSTMRRDGELRPVQFNSRDHWCLDGARLVAVAAGEYRTEPDTAVKVKAGSSDASGIVEWTVYSKDGRIAHYGGSENARVIGRIHPLSGPPPVTALVWLERRVEDRSGNFMTFTYQREPDAAPLEEVEWAIAQIDYAGSSATDPETAPTRRVVFENVARGTTDQRIEYVMGVAVHHRLRPRTIAMQLGTELVRRYQLSYETSAVSGRDRLAKLELCDRPEVPARPDHCVARRFVYQGAAGTPAPIPIFAKTSLGAAQFQSWGKMLSTNDVDGDGRDDLVYRDTMGQTNRQNDKIAIRKSTGPVTLPTLAPAVYQSNVGTANLTSLSLYDINGDGGPDAIGDLQSSYCCGGTCGTPTAEHCTRRTPHLFPNPITTGAFSAGSVFTFFDPADTGDAWAQYIGHGDFNGDLRPDLVQQRQNSSPGLYLGDVDIQHEAAWLALERCPRDTQGNPRSSCDAVPASLAQIADIDGDGAPEILMPYVISTSGPSNAPYDAGQIGYDAIQLRGHTIEVVPTNLTDSYYSVYQFAADGLVILAREKKLADRACFVFADVNGDGLTDQVSVKAGLPIRMNLGGGRFGTVELGLPGFPGLACASDFDFDPNNDLSPGVSVVDVDHDGRADLLLAGGQDAAHHALPARFLRSTGAGFQGLTPAQGTTLPGGLVESWALRTLDVNADGLFDVVQMANNGNLELFVQTTRYPDLLDHVELDDARHDAGARSVTDWKVSYAPISWTPEYVPIQGGPWLQGAPWKWYVGSLLVVTDERVPDATSRAAAPAGRVDTLVVARHHTYESAKVDSLGEGWLGFTTHTVTDPRTGVWTRTRYDTTPHAALGGHIGYAFKGLPIDRFTVAPPSETSLQKVTRTTTAYDVREHAGLYFTYPKTVIESEYTSFDVNDPDRSTPILQTTSGTVVDDYGTVIQSTVDRGNDRVTTTTRTAADAATSCTDAPTPQVSNDAETWLIGLVEREVVTSKVPGACRARTMRHTYDGSGRMVDSIREPDGDANTLRCTTVAARDAFGSPTVVDVKSASCDHPLETRTTTTAYDADGTFVVSVKNPLGHTTVLTVHPGLGVPVTEQDPNGLVTTRQYDGWGRQVRIDRPDGTFAITTRTACASSTLGICTTDTASDGRTSTIQRDRLGQAIRTVTRALDGRASKPVSDVYRDTEYDLLGRVVAEKRPYFADVAATYYAARRTYDAAGRTIRVCQHDATKCARTTYAGLVTDQFDENNRQRRTTLRPWGALESTAIYPSSTAVTTTYTDGPFDMVASVTDAKTNQVKMSYDDLGRTTGVEDPDRGTRSIGYNAFDEVTTTTDARGVITTLTYDALGRLTRRAAAGDDADTWSYDCAPGTATCTQLGLLRERTRGAVATSYTYDALARPKTEHWTIDGAGFEYGFLYDDQGRLRRLNYPEVPNRAPFGVTYLYGPTGEVLRLTDPASGQTLWNLDQAAADGSIMLETAGNQRATTRTYDPATGRVTRTTTPSIHDVSYLYEPDGDLQSRTDYRNSSTASAVTKTETFAYDGAGRLTSAKVVGRLPETFSYTYDAIGNVLTAGDRPECTSLVYGGLGKGPHQLTKATCGGTAFTHTYDPNGNESLTRAPDTREQIWTSFDKVSEVASRHGRMHYTYDAEHRRVKKERVPGALTGMPAPETPALNDALSAVWDTTLYVGDLYERRKLSGSSTVEHVFYLRAGGAAPIGQLIRSVPANTDSWLYYHRDRQGSVERFTDANGAFAGAASYDAWGMHRNPSWTSAASFSLPAKSRLGYTGHSHDDEVAGGLIDMGGRTYDAYFKRFTSPDSIVQAPEYGPSWNRYAYVYNNPINFTDPSGHRSVGADSAAYWQYIADALELGGGCMTCGFRMLDVRLTADGKIETLNEGLGLDFIAGGFAGVVDAAPPQDVSFAGATASTRVYAPITQAEYDHERRVDEARREIEASALTLLEDRYGGTNLVLDTAWICEGFSPCLDSIVARDIAIERGAPEQEVKAFLAIGMVIEMPWPGRATYERPSGFRENVRETVWKNNKGPDGFVRDPRTGAVMDPKQPWHMGHKPGHEFWRHVMDAFERNLSREEFLNEHNDPNRYRPELPSSNTGHGGEDKTPYRGRRPPY